MSAPLRLFEGFGIEIEWMIADRESLDIRPLSDRILEAQAGEITPEVEVGPLAWSNELVLHVIELKTNGPAARLSGLDRHFHQQALSIQDILAPHGARLLPTGMHPWMDPDTETHLWPYEYGPVYATYDRIFGCKGHGWSNLQSVHINLPFGDDSELGVLHEAIRRVLPLIPGLAASTPVRDGRIGKALDGRVEVYRTNSARVPQVSGRVVPEGIRTQKDYEDTVFAPMYAAIAPLDPDQVLRHEWLNARGAIVRFDRNAIEIRLVDVQECPRADIAVCAAVCAAVKDLVRRLQDTTGEWPLAPIDPLADLLNQTVYDGERTPIPAVIQEALFLKPGTKTVGGAWRELVDRARRHGDEDLETYAQPVEHILREGPLARRILKALPTTPDRGALRSVWGSLGNCMTENRLF